MDWMAGPYLAMWKCKFTDCTGIKDQKVLLRLALIRAQSTINIKRRHFILKEDWVQWPEGSSYSVTSSHWLLQRSLQSVNYLISHVTGLHRVLGPLNITQKFNPLNTEKISTYTVCLCTYVLCSNVQFSIFVLIHNRYSTIWCIMLFH